MVSVLPWPLSGSPPLGRPRCDLMGASLAVVPLGAVLLLDRRRWAAIETNFGWGGSEFEVAQIAVELSDQGVVTQVHTE